MVIIVEVVWIIMIALAVFLILGVPIAFSIGLATFIGLIVGGTAPEMLGQGALIALDSFAVMAVPFFILTGTIMETAGLSERLLIFAKSFVRNIKEILSMVK